MRFDTLRLEIDRRIATLTLNRPLVGNAIDEKAALELGDACEQLGHDDDVWVVVVAGAGDSFCLGTESSAFEGVGDPFQALRSLRVSGSVGAIEKPVIAALTGDAVDQGLELALACDIRIASRRATFGLTQVKSGRIPWDGGTQRLPRLVGRGRAMEMILSGRLVDAREALDIGLVSQVAEPDRVLSRAQEVASVVAGHAPIAARFLKEAVLSGLDLTLVEGLRLEADLNVVLQSTLDRAEGIRSFLERRTASYRGE